MNEQRDGFMAVAGNGGSRTNYEPNTVAGVSAACLALSASLPLLTPDPVCHALLLSACALTDAQG